MLVFTRDCFFWEGGPLFACGNYLAMQQKGVLHGYDSGDNCF